MTRRLPLLPTFSVAVFALLVGTQAIAAEEKGGTAAPASMPTETPAEPTATPQVETTPAAALPNQGKVLPDPGPGADVSNPAPATPPSGAGVEPAPKPEAGVGVHQEGSGTSAASELAPTASPAEGAGTEPIQAAPKEPVATPPSENASPSAGISHNGAEPTAQPSMMQLSTPLPPRSLQTVVDERRDLLRERRRAMLEAWRGPHGAMPPAFRMGYLEALERYRDAVRALHRQQRDYARMQHDIWMDAVAPWSRAQRAWSKQRSYQRQMEQLDRQELQDWYLHGRPLGYGTPAP